MGGRVITDVEGTSLADEEAELLCHPAVAGVILFSKNFESIEQLQVLVNEIRSCRSELIICVDQEGGRVQRFRDPELTRLPPLACLRPTYERDTELAQEHAKQLGWLMASEMLALGIDLSFAPVLDIDYGRNEVIGDRAFGTSSEQVVLLASAYIAGMRDAGMAVCGKHFPGHGFVDLDSHVALPVDARPLEAVLADMAPFVQLAPELDSIMTAHVVYENADKLPASFSEYWLQEQLRNALAFEGLIISDDLHMQGAWGQGTPRERAHQALEAGCDLLIYCNDPKGAEQVITGLEDLAELQPSRRLPLRKAAAPGWGKFKDSEPRKAALETLSDYL